MDTSKIIKGVVSNGRYTVTSPIVKEDYGLYLQIEGVELPPTYQVDFSNSENSGTSVTMIGNSDGVLIPRQFIDSGKDVFAFLYHVGADFGRTVYKFRIPNKVRPDRTNEEPTPEEQNVIDQVIASLNDAVDRAEDAEQAIENMSVSATTLADGASATVTKTESEGVVHLTFGIPKGATGAQGDKGDKGDKGDTGAQGIQGIQGERGLTGAKGDKGDKGEKGDKGDTGEVTQAEFDELSGEVTDLKEDLSAMSTATSSDVGKALIAKTVTDGKVAEWKFGSTGSGSGLTQSQKLAILNCFAHVAWTDAQGQTYYDELEAVLFPPAELTSISATYVNSNPVYTDTDIDTLKQYITVTAHYSDGTSSVVNAYTLSGTLTVGTSTLTVAYSEMTTTISVTVTATPKSDMNGWTDGVMYTDIEVVEDKYFDDGAIKSYGGWDRTGYIPCHGASTIVFEAADIANGLIQRFNGFFDENKSYIQSMGTVPASGATITVPSNAHYFGFSGEDAKVAAFISAGFIPHA